MAMVMEYLETLYSITTFNYIYWYNIDKNNEEMHMNRLARRCHS